MNQLPENITAAAYFNGLQFDRVDTYSLLRGADYKEQLEMLRVERDALELRQTGKSDLSLGDERRLAWLNEQLSYTQYLTNKDGVFHWSARRVGTFRSDHPVAKRLRAIMTKEPVEIMRMVCAPVYRDGLVFYNGPEVVSVLNVCLSCKHLETAAGEKIDADYQVYDLLKKLFLKIGHEVEQPDYFTGTDIDMRKEQHRQNTEREEP